MDARIYPAGHSEIIEGIAMTHIQLDRIEKLVGGGEVQILQKRNGDLFEENRQLRATIIKAREAMEMETESVAYDILLRKGDSGNGPYRSTT